jgi:hypothetical protein
VLGSVSLPARADGPYPDWSGQWTDMDVSRWDPSKPNNLGQQAPLTPEYQAVLLEAMADRRRGGFGNTPTINCGHPGMPRSMLVYEAMELVVQPKITHIMFDFVDPLRRIYTDGRNWPASIQPTWMGYSIGQWERSTADGGYDTLVVETRGFKGPRVVDGSGIQLHDDNQTVIKERIYLDKQNPDVLKDEITLIDNAFTRPWTVTRSYKRHRNHIWAEFSCGEANAHFILGREHYLLSADGHLMPTRKNQPPPDTRYFNVPRN